MMSMMWFEIENVSGKKITSPQWPWVKSIFPAETRVNSTSMGSGIWFGPFGRQRKQENDGPGQSIIENENDGAMRRRTLPDSAVSLGWALVSPKQLISSSFTYSISVSVCVSVLTPVHQVSWFILGQIVRNPDAKSPPRLAQWTPMTSTGTLTVLAHFLSLEHWSRQKVSQRSLTTVFIDFNNTERGKERIFLNNFFEWQWISIQSNAIQNQHYHL